MEKVKVKDYLLTKDEGMYLVGSKSGYLAGGDPKNTIQMLYNWQSEQYQRYVIMQKCKPEEFRDHPAKTFDDFNLTEREIIETRFSNYQGAEVVLIKGEEVGKYWTLKEIMGEEDVPPNLEDVEAVLSLRDAIIEQAFDDYSSVLRYEYGKQKGEFIIGQCINRESYERTKKTIEKFMRSGWFKALADMDGVNMMSEFRRIQMAEVIPELPRIKYKSKNKKYTITQAYNGHVVLMKDTAIIWQERTDNRYNIDALKELYKEHKI